MTRTFCWIGVGTLILLSLSACGGGSGGEGAHLLPPTPPNVTVSAYSATPGTKLNFSASSSDPQSDLLTYAWDFGDGTIGTGASISHTYTSEGQYTAKVVVTDQHNLASTGNSRSIQVSQTVSAQMTVTGVNYRHLLGQAFTATVIAGDDAVSWDFGDGSTGSGGFASHVYAKAGIYTVTLTVARTADSGLATHMTVEVATPGPLPSQRDNEFAPYCSGPYCGAVSAARYSGDGVGIWRYHNATNAAATLDISIAGVSAGETAVLVFSNGQVTAAQTLPGVGTLAATASEKSAPVAKNAHTVMLERNAAFTRDLLLTGLSRARAQSVAAPDVAQAVASTPPAIGTAREWVEALSAVKYAMQVGATCALVDGRNAIFWVDSRQWASGAMTPKDVNGLAATFCGATGVYARLTALFGAPYGPAATAFGNLIQDSPQRLQDINIVIPDVPPVSWGGYCSLGDVTLKSRNPDSNEALAVFLPGSAVAGGGERQQGEGLVLAHELKHLINFYQRALARGTQHADFLEETSALMAQDVLHQVVEGDPMSFAGSYLSTDGRVSYLEWVEASWGSYDQGGAVGEFLHRRYGLDVDRQLISDCADDATALKSYQCLDQISMRLGGNGFEDDFARLGASVFGLIPRDGIPNGFGFPSQLYGEYALPSDTSFGEPLRPAAALTNGFRPTLHTYQVDNIVAGQTTYSRKDVAIPAGTTLVLVITQPPPTP